MRKAVLSVAAVCLVLLSGCGDSRPTNLLVLGNSITYNPPNNRGWHGHWGMAAPSAADDFAHRSAAQLNLSLTVMSMYIEVDPQGSLPLIASAASQVGAGTAVVLEFGDDVPDGGLQAFAQAYTVLAAAVSKGQSLVCTSTWWEKPDVDEVIKSICGTYGGRYAFIGDLYTDPANTDLKTIQFSNPRINSHPREWGHQHIADRVVLLIKDP
jgi:hypothetical protein